MRLKLVFVSIGLMLLLAACGGNAAPTLQPSEPASSNGNTGAVAATEMPPAAGVDTASAEMPSASAASNWQTLELVNARTGETFKLSDFAGKTVYLEPMATWCTNCRRQMKTVIDVLPQVDPGKVVFVGVSVAENVDNQTLANYVDEQGFTWLFAIATPELGRALIDRFGQSAVTPPATPHIIIYPDGTTSELITGYHDVAGILAMVGES